MPLAKYITAHLAMTEGEAATAIQEDWYDDDGLRTLLKHEKRPAIRDIINARINQTEMPLEKSNVHSVHISTKLHQAAHLINRSYEVLTKPARAASRSVIEIGIIMLAVKDQLPHGQLEKWRDENTNLTKRWDVYCRKAAQKFIEANGMQIAALLCDPTQAEDDQDVVMAEQLLMDFTGGKGPSALLHDLGIKKRPSAEPKEPISDEERDRLLAESSWTELLNRLADHDEDWMQLTDAQIRAIDEILWPIASSVHKAAKGGTQ